MRAVQVLMEEKQIAAVDREATRARVNRSDLPRAAAAHYLRASRRAALERQHIAGYHKRPVPKDEVAAWQRVQVWDEP